MQGFYQSNRIVSERRKSMKAYSHKEIEEILNTYGDTVYRMAYTQIKSKTLADDIYQDVCVKLLKQKRKIELEEHLKAWLLRTTMNCCKDYWKSAWVQKISWNSDTKETLETMGAAYMESETGFVTECVLNLPEKYRTVIHLYYYEGYRQKEIAKLLGKKENTIASQLARGKALLKIELEKDKEGRYGIQGII